MQTSMNLVEEFGMTSKTEDTAVSGEVDLSVYGEAPADDPISKVVEETTAAENSGIGGFVSAHKSALIKGGAALGVMLVGGLMVRHFVKKANQAGDIGRESEPEPEEIRQNVIQAQQTVVQAQQANSQAVHPSPSAVVESAAEEPGDAVAHMEFVYLTVPKPTDEVLAEARKFQAGLLALKTPDEIKTYWGEHIQLARVTGTFLGVPVRGYPTCENVSYDRTLELCQQVNAAMFHWANGGKADTVSIKCFIEVTKYPDGSITRLAKSAVLEPIQA